MKTFNKLSPVALVACVILGILVGHLTPKILDKYKAHLKTGILGEVYLELRADLEDGSILFPIEDQNGELTYITLVPLTKPYVGTE